MVAALTGYTETVKILLEKGAAVDELDVDGKTAVQLAKKFNQSQTAGLIERWQREHVAEIAEAWAREQAAAQIEKLKTLRPKKSPFKGSQP
jgi:hypothetical protein